MIVDGVKSRDFERCACLKWGGRLCPLQAGTEAGPTDCDFRIKQRAGICIRRRARSSTIAVRMPVTISIVTPSFNQAEFLERTLRSVLAQRDFVHEYFVIDGGSTDGSAEIIARHADQIDYWVSEKDKGQGDAIHRGFQRATGDVLYWLNSDDVLLPGALRAVQAAFDAKPDLDVVTGHGVFIDGDDRIVSVRRRPPDSPRRMRWGYLRVNQPCCFFRRRLYETVGGIDQELQCVLDTELWYRFASRNTQWGSVDAYLAAMRLHSQTKGATLRDRYQQERDLMKQRHPQFTASKLRHSLGRAAYYISQIGSGRAIQSRNDARRMVGKRLDEVRFA